MSLSDILRRNRPQSKFEFSEERVRANLDGYRALVAYWRWYPDKLVDWLCSLDPDSTFRLYFFQRVFLRVAMRHKTVYAVFSRGFSKSFLAVLVLALKAILYPGAKLAAASDGKSQSASIVSSKLVELCSLIPALANEIVWDTRGQIQQTRQTKDSVSYVFRNGLIYWLM